MEDAKKIKLMQIYIYVDTEHDECEVFTTLEAAKIHADNHWPDCVEEWDNCMEGRLHRDPYQFIWIKSIPVKGRKNG